jgi:membrane-associated phospholipid phosphatase
MARDQDSSDLLRSTSIAFVACVIAVVVCYYFVDRPVAFFVHRHGIAKFDEFRWLTEPPPLVQIWAPLVLAVLLVLGVRQPWRRWQHVLFVACVSLIVADQFRGSLGDLFGRYWPETWRDNNLSLIGTGTYGFDLFKADNDNGSFPSGHAARIVGLLSVFWLAMPRGRWLYVLLAAPMLVALVAMNYHFVGDVIAGSVLGGIVGAWAMQLSGLDQDTENGRNAPNDAGDRSAGRGTGRRL